MRESIKRQLKFVATIAVSMVVMYLVMYLNTFAGDHARWSETRLYMTVLMGSSMAVVMLVSMWGMYESSRFRTGVLVGCAALFGGALWLVRSQQTVDDSSYMSAMIPHHSIAILTSERAQIEDVRVRALADDIISAQRDEIGEMEWLLEDIERHGPARTEQEAARRPVPASAGGVQPDEAGDPGAVASQ